MVKDTIELALWQVKKSWMILAGYFQFTIANALLDSYNEDILSMNDKSPHNSRIFTANLVKAGTNIALWAFLVSMFSVNFFALSHWRLSYSDKLLDVFRRPFVWDSHMTLAQSLQQTTKESATKELLVASELFSQNNSGVLGVSTTPLDLLRAWNNEPAQREYEIQFWQGATQRYPDYRDAYIQLAYLSYIRGDLIQAKRYTLQAQAIDPNGEMIRKLVEFLSKK